MPAQVRRMVLRFAWLCSYDMDLTVALVDTQASTACHSDWESWDQATRRDHLLQIVTAASLEETEASVIEVAGKRVEKCWRHLVAHRTAQWVRSINDHGIAPPATTVYRQYQHYLHRLPESLRAPQRAPSLVDRRTASKWSHRWRQRWGARFGLLKPADEDPLDLRQRKVSRSLRSGEEKGGAQPGRWPTRKHAREAFPGRPFVPRMWAQNPGPEPPSSSQWAPWAHFSACKSGHPSGA